jgi:hypothetical protein
MSTLTPTFMIDSYIDPVLHFALLFPLLNYALRLDPRPDDVDREPAAETSGDATSDVYFYSL